MPVNIEKMSYLVILKKKEKWSGIQDPDPDPGYGFQDPDKSLADALLFHIIWFKKIAWPPAGGRHGMSPPACNNPTSQTFIAGHGS